MAGRSPARFLAPIAILAFVFALYTVINDARDRHGVSGSTTPTATATTTGKKTSKKTSTKKKAKTYTVKSGDTLSGIAEKTGVDASKLVRLNPRLDPATLAPGQRIKLR